MAARKRIVVWVVEDDKLLRESLADEAFDLGIKLVFFEYMAELGTTTGNPHSIIADLGSVASIFLPGTHHYLSVLRTVRERFPGAPIYLHSGIEERITEIQEDMADPMVHLVRLKDFTNLLPLSAGLVQ